MTTTLINGKEVSQRIREGLKTEIAALTAQGHTPGLAVWHDGHIGVYIGDGYVIEAMNTKKGVVKTKLEGRGWTHWLQIEYINYD